MNTACRQQMATETLFHKVLINLSIIYFQISNIFQLNYIERISCRYMYIWLLHACFAESLSSMIACYWKSMYQELKEVNSWNVTDWSIMMKVHESFIHVSLFFFSLTGVTEIVNAQGSDKDWYLTSWNKYTDTKSCHL